MFLIFPEQQAAILKRCLPINYQKKSRPFLVIILFIPNYGGLALPAHCLDRSVVVWQYGLLTGRLKKMLKKTTIYLEEEELQKLKALSFILNTSMTDLIRKGIQALYDSMPKEQTNALKNLSSVKSDFDQNKTKKAATPKSSNKRNK